MGDRPSMVSRRIRAQGGRAWKVIRANWHLGVTAFGGPPVHFRIFNEKFVKKLEWIDEQVFQELFSILQSLSGPASTKMLYCINLIRDGFPAALLSFLIWSLPGALDIYGLSIGVLNIDETLPGPVYALLSGLNAAMVGVIVLAAVELSQKAITNRLTRTIVFLSGTVGMLYNALWYFPVLMAASGLATLAFDFRWFHRPVAKLAAALSRLWDLWPSRRSAQVHAGTEAIETPHISFEPNSSDAPTPPTTSELPITEHAAQQQVTNNPSTAETEPRIIPPSHQLPIRLTITWQSGAAIIASFLMTFIVTITLRSTLHSSSSPLLYRLFANMYLAGTIIFGGGPVVVSLLRKYIVAEGQVTPRDFLIGLALIQAFPGLNFNFAVFLGSLTALKEGGGGGHSSSLAGAVVAWVGIFAPELVLVHGTIGIWSALRGRRWVKSALRGVNTGAVGLIYMAVYCIFGVGYIDDRFQAGRSLGDNPWWVAITATIYVGGRYFDIQAPLAIVLCAVLGLLRYAMVSA